MRESTTTTVYVRRHVEDGDAAAALPDGALLLIKGGVADRDAQGRWWIGLAQVPPRALHDLEALVPVTATVERQWVETYPGGGRITFQDPIHTRPDRGAVVSTATRYTTPWTPEEEA